MGNRKRRDLLTLTAHGEHALRIIAQVQLKFDSPERTIVLLATLAEEHVATVLRALVSRDEGVRSDLYQYLLDDVDDSMYRSWESMYKWLKAGFGLTFSGGKEAQLFDSLVQLRNAIVHGNGNLTHLQMQKFSYSVDLRGNLSRNFDVAFSGNFVTLGDRTSFVACVAVKDFILYFDAVVLVRYPDLLSV